MASRSKGVPTDEGLRELALRARAGDRDAAYEILGDQVPTETWVAVIDALAREADGVDLEIVAHRTLRRPPAEVSIAVLRLASAAGTAQAAFVARAVAALRTEEHVVTKASRVREELSETNHPVDLLADGRPTDALYAMLAISLQEQADVLARIGTEDPARPSLLDALRVEYERLQETAKDQRWRSGSYRHLLRHALADLALIAHAGGKLEDQAYRLLQQRTEAPEANRELLALLPEETRRAYLAWVVDRPPGKEETARALFALDEIEQRYPSDIDHASVVRLLQSRDQEIALAAAGLLTRTRPDDKSIDHALADLIAQLPVAERTSLVEQVARDAPERVRLDLWPADADAALAQDVSRALTEVLLSVFEAAADPGVRARALGLLVDRANDELATGIARAALGRTMEPQASELQMILEKPALRAGLWSAIAEGAQAPPTPLLAALIAHTDPQEAAGNLATIHRKKEPSRNEIEAIALAGLEAGTIAADPIVGTELESAIEERVEERLDHLTRRLEGLRELVIRGDRAAEAELEHAVQELVKRAIERSTGNERLIANYMRLGRATNDTAPEPEHAEPMTVVDPSEVESLAGHLGKSGVHIGLAEGIEVAIDQDASDASLLRALALVDHRIARAPEAARHTVSSVRDAVAALLAKTGLAQKAMGELADGGPLRSALTTMSASARNSLFDAASDAGFVPPAAWSEHPILGQWMAARADDSRGDDPTASSVGTPTVALGRTARDLRDAESRLAVARNAARLAFFRASESVFEEIEQTIDAYVQIWIEFGRLGLGRVAPAGAILHSDELDPRRHEIADDVRGTEYVVRYPGVIIGDDVVRRARLEVY